MDTMTVAYSQVGPTVNALSFKCSYVLEVDSIPGKGNITLIHPLTSI
jgi:hypothetical protein